MMKHAVVKVYRNGDTNPYAIYTDSASRWIFDVRVNSADQSFDVRYFDRNVDPQEQHTAAWYPMWGFTFVVEYPRGDGKVDPIPEHLDGLAHAIVSEVSIEEAGKLLGMTYQNHPDFRKAIESYLKNVS